MTITDTGLEFEFPALKETLGEIDTKTKALAKVFEEAGTDRDLSLVKSVDGGKDAVLAFIRETNDELTELGKKRDEQVALAKGVKAVDGYDPDEFAALFESGTPGAGPSKQKSFGELFVESKAGLELKGREVEIDYDVKTLFETGTGWTPQAVRGPRVVDYATRTPVFLDLVPTTTTTQTAIVYMEETTFTNAAVEVAEGDAKPEGALALTERTDTVRKIAVWIPVTDEQLEDVNGISGYLNNRLTLWVQQRLEAEVIAGDGTAPNISGILDRSGLQTQAKGTDPTPDAVYKAMTKVRVTGQAMPNFAAFHPNDWQEIRLLRTADGIYIWGNPSEAGPERIWGLTVTQVQALTEGTGLVGDTSYLDLAIKKGMTIKVSDSHSTYFVENKQAVLAEMRAALAVYRPAAFCSVTGI